MSVFCGSVIWIYLWISINTLLMKLLNVNGQIIIILIGIPIISYIVKNLREYRIENLQNVKIDKIQSGFDALLQVNNLADFSKGIYKDENQKIQMVGLINMHINECQNFDCPCKDEYEIFDVITNKFTERNK